MYKNIHFFIYKGACFFWISPLLSFAHTLLHHLKEGGAPRGPVASAAVTAWSGPTGFRGRTGCHSGCSARSLGSHSNRQGPFEQDRTTLDPTVGIEACRSCSSGVRSRCPASKVTTTWCDLQAHPPSFLRLCRSVGPVWALALGLRCRKERNQAEGAGP